MSSAVMRSIALAILLAAPAWSMQLPPDIQADRYLLRAQRQIEEQDFAGAKQSLDQILELEAQHGLEIPVEFFFRYAEVVERLGLFDEASASATRYLTLAGREGEHYRAALELLDKAELAMAAAEAAAAAAAEAARRKPGESRVFDGIQFVWVPAGEFLMGSESEEAYDVEQPLTRVRISQGFFLGKYEVTQAEWRAVMGTNPAQFSGCGSDCPVENVSWDDTQEFIGKLNAAVGEERYRLPTEAEWEYAARAGTKTDTPAGDLDIVGRNNAPLLDGIAWYGGNSGVSYAEGYDCSDWGEKQYASSRCGTHPAGGKAPNAWGLYDMLGNVWEWVGDWYGPYPGGSVTDPRGPVSGSDRVTRGGGWRCFARYCRAPTRLGYPPGYRYRDLGFRLLRTE